MQGSRQVLRLTALAAVIVLGVAASALGQGATGTITGIVKDAQGGVMPGATVTITSDTRGTHLAPVVTGGAGDFVVPNIAADTYTVQIEMPSFRTLAPGRRRGEFGIDRRAWHDHDRRRRHDRSGQRCGRDAAGADGERRTIVHGDHGVGRESAAAGPHLRAVAVAGAGRRGDTRRAEPGDACRRRWRRQLHARWRDGHGSGHQSSGHAHQRRVARGSQARHLDVSGRVRALRRTANQRRHQERHQPVPRLGVSGDAQFRLELESPDQHRQRRSEAERRSDGLRVLGRRSGRTAGRPEQAVLLLQPRSQSAHRSAAT